MTATAEPTRLRRAGSNLRRRVVTALALAAAAFGLWLLAVGSVKPGELLVGGAVAALAATGCTVVGVAQGAHFAPRLAHLALVATLPKQVFVETWRVLVLLARHVFTREEAQSIVYEAPFPHGGDHRRAASRRALATIYASATPATVVIGFDADRGVILFHRLEPGPAPDVVERLRRDP